MYKEKAINFLEDEEVGTFGKAFYNPVSLEGFYKETQEFDPIKVFSKDGQMAEIKITTSKIGEKYSTILAENEELKKEIEELKKQITK